MSFNEIIMYGLPFGIAGLVVFPMLDSSYHVRRSGFRTQVSNKIGEAVFPTSTNTNTMRSIVLKVSAFWIVASLFHRNPDIVFTRPFSAVRCFDAAHNFLTKATATTRCAVFKILSAHYGFCSAIASAIPKRLSILIRSATNNGPSCKTPSDQIFRKASLWHILELVCEGGSVQ